MPLKGSAAALGKKMADTMKNADSYEKAWAVFAENMEEYLIENAVVVGLAPSGGGPITEGKIQ
ncbi:MAG TPA: hypothetical protein VE954_19645 [Oligoflexus sp.]|uniref:hypothetical protein n=1 Tax=Oligoflexus sp. TaxID=1971216 RepID=UPI002D46D642|nr:hypothetical protein [Oligoflexus sp.]HYX35316.1 hypothetical protein [Oligoflexus sp.]